MVVFACGHNTVTNYLVFADATLFLEHLVTLGTIGLIALVEEFGLQFFPTVMALEALFVVDLSIGSTSILGKCLSAAITVSCWFVNNFSGSVPNPSSNLWVVQVGWIGMFAGTGSSGALP